MGKHHLVQLQSLKMRISALLMISTSFGTAYSRSCGNGWFGSKCQYRCHCENGQNCAELGGGCPGRCEGGWFGTGCQFKDMAYNQSDKVRDGNDETCQILHSSVLLVTFNLPARFSFVRLVLKEEAQASIWGQAADGGQAQVTNPVQKINVSKLITDFHGEYDRLVFVLIVTFAKRGVQVCSIYFNGGRNVALKQEAHQFFPTGTYAADHAVDGDPNQNHQDGKCSYTGGNPFPSWTLELDRPVLVDRFVLYNRNDILRCRLRRFRLQTWNSAEQTLTHQDRDDSEGQLIYDVRFPGGVEATKVTIDLPPLKKNHSEENRCETSWENTLTLCEVMIFGDTVCPANKWGLECEKDCNCQSEACFVSTGSCLAPTCPMFVYGVECNNSCSENCDGLKTCSPSNGHCTYGCQKGFKPPTCHDECDPGEYGQNCTKRCDRCEADPQTGKPSCYVETGFCKTVCPEGFTGENCFEEIEVKDHSVTKVMKENLGVIILYTVLGVLGVASLVRRCLAHQDDDDDISIDLEEDNVYSDSVADTSVVSTTY